MADTGRLPYPVKRGQVAYVLCDDLARAAADALLSTGTRGDVLELTAPAAISMPALAADVSITTGREIRFQTVGEAELLDIGLGGDEPPLISRRLLSR